MAYPTPLLDQIQNQHRQQNEQERLATLAKTTEWLEKNAQTYGIVEAYLFGSVIRPYGFTTHSDVDLAVEQIDPQLFFQAMADLSERLEREVDLVELSKCHFGDRLRQKGIKWTVPD
ncbi:nucleotidyltransferase domain-containing protein [Synechocystis salina LEGE 06099]|uniref:nucleotidyltransferase family protein n=1 Tax=Synechocystis salina TaxID=945780 RepID=UPI0018826B35|nr:nucleotidyltransferase domain-containing protein [Synechocystis salina]MBE9204432.1 nucleotidyltransferase domain-containing protein [Synechocystis salina LEGE 06099]